MTRLLEALVAIIFGAAVTAAGRLPVWGARLVYLPGLVVAGALGGSFDEPGRLSEKTTVVVTVVVSLVFWAAVAYGVLLASFKKRAA